MGVYLYKAKTQILTELTYRFEVFATLLTKYIQVIAVVFLWECVYRSQNTLQGMTKEQMITWIILATGCSIIFTTNVQSFIHQGVWQGTVAVDLLRPCNLLGLYLAQDIGSSVVNMIVGFMPTVLLGGLTFHILLPVSGNNFLLCIISMVAGYLINWLLFALVGVLAFWTMNLGSMGWALSTLISICSGGMIPLYFFPESVQKILAWLPFPYTYQTSLSLYIGRITWREGLEQIALQIIWIAVLIIALKLLWNRARKNILVQGG